MTAPRRRPSSLAHAAAATYGTNLATALLSLGNVLLVARGLGPSGRGEVALLMTIPLLVSQLANFGIHEANANLGASDPRLRSALATNSVLLAISLGLTAAALVMGVVVVFPSVAAGLSLWLLALALSSMPVLILKRYLSLLAQSDYRFGVTNLAWLSGPATTFTLNGILVLAGVLTVTGAIVVWILGQVLGVCLVGGSVARHFGFARPDAALARRTLRFGAKTHLGRSMEIGTYRIDQWFVGAMAGTRELGYYSVAVAWAELLFYLPGVAVLLQRPDLVRAAREEARFIAAQMMRRILCLAVVAAGGLVLLAPLLCTVFFGEEFANSVDDLRVLATAGIGITVMEVLNNTLVAQRHPLLASAGGAATFAVTIVLDVVLIPPLAGVGAAIATTAAYTSGAVVVTVIFCRVLGASPRDLLPRVADLAWYRRKAGALLSSLASATAAPASPSSAQKKRS
jgi:O-antigen/teichoic acid export membrane protein